MGNPILPFLSQGEIRFHLSPFQLCVHIIFFFAWKTSHLPRIVQKTNIPRSHFRHLLREIPLSSSLFNFVYISFFLFVEDVPNHHPWRLQIVVRFRFWSLLNTKWILDLAPIDWVGHCQRCTFSISCTWLKYSYGAVQSDCYRPEIFDERLDAQTNTCQCNFLPHAFSPSGFSRCMFTYEVCL